MKVAKIKIDFFILIWRDSPFSRATIKCDLLVYEFNHVKNKTIFFRKKVLWHDLQKINKTAINTNIIYLNIKGLRIVCYWNDAEQLLFLNWWKIYSYWYERLEWLGLWTVVSLRLKNVGYKTFRSRIRCW